MPILFKDLPEGGVEVEISVPPEPVSEVKQAFEEILKFLEHDLPTHSKIKSLKLANNIFLRGGNAQLNNLLLSALQNNKSITSLDLSGNNLGVKGAVRLAEVVKDCPHLKELILSGNKFGAEGAGILMKAFAGNETLESLDLSENGIMSVDVLHDKKAEWLETARNWLIPTAKPGFQVIAPNLKNLNLSGNPIGLNAYQGFEPGVGTFLADIFVDGKLRNLNVGNCNLDNANINELASRVDELMLSPSNAVTGKIKRTKNTDGDSGEEPPCLNLTGTSISKKEIQAFNSCVSQGLLNLQTTLPEPEKNIASVPEETKLPPTNLTSRLG